MRSIKSIYPLIIFILFHIPAISSELPQWKKKWLPEDDTWKSVDQHFVLNNGADPETFDIHKITGVTEFRISKELFEGLTTLDPETLEIRPGTAASWDISRDGLKYKFHIRKEAKWSDGKDLTAQDFILSWKRLLTTETAAPYANLLFHVKGTKEFYEGKIEFARVGLKALGEKTLEVSLAIPCTYFLDLTAFAVLFPIRVDIIETFKEKWLKPENLVCNGPFRLQEYSPRRHVVLIKNNTYWDKNFVKLEKITFRPLDDLNTSYKLYLEGGLHWMPGLPTARIEEIKRHPDYYAAPYLGTYFYRFNVTKYPFNDPKIRRAFSLSINRREITEGLLKGGQHPVSSYCPPVSGYKPIKGLSYDRKKAITLFKDAGFGPSQKPFPDVEILYNTSESHKMIAEAIARGWKETFGINITSRNQEWKVYLSDTKDLKFQIARSSWIGDYGDPNTFFEIFKSTDGNNRTGWSNERYDALLEKAALERNHEKRLALFSEMEKILVEDECPIMPIYRYVNQGLLSESVMGWYQNIRDIHPLKYVWME